ncbi:contact-dependent growth inhibition system immunity protein [Nocardia aurantia]|uniref:contact-dependent growth inhibition system immunity protein n=1 Tax=Nocardia aurantia TaxID=2585199 RepID=UPI0012955755|nr:contact-dependent growth inhibition system immunity protein [Nocardia aurantia]
MTRNEFDDRTLENIDGHIWGDPPVDATRLMKKVYSLRRKQIHAMTAEDLRVLLGQRENISVLVPRALALLEGNPLVQGDFYPGDLLVAALQVSDDYWSRHSDMAARLGNIIEQLRVVDDLEFFFPPEAEIWDRIERLRESGIIG